MCRHVVRTFQGMRIVGSPFRDHYIHVPLKIGPYGGVCVLIEGKAGRGMPDKDVQEPGTNSLKFRESLLDLPGDQVKSPGKGPELYFALKPGHIKIKFTLSAQERRRKSTDKITFAPETGPMDLKDVKLVVTDMDGTLLDSAHRVSDRFFELQEALGRRGVRFAAASGRQYQSIAVKLTPILGEVFIIAENGGLLRHRETELLSTPMDPVLRDEVLRTLEGIPGAHTVLCGKERAYLRPPVPAFREQLTEYYTEFEYLDELQGFRGEIMKIAVYHFDSSETYIYPKVQPYENRLKVKVSGAHWVDLSDPKAHKGRALELLQKHLGIPPEATLAFGDYNNDLEMLERAAFSYAMANAHPNVLQTARFKTLSNDEQGVEHILEQLLAALG